MATAHDVAAYIIESLGPVTPMKLQKLLFYCQAWHLVCRDEPLFPEAVLAWEHGPVIQEVWQARAGSRARLREWPEGNAAALLETEAEVVKAVLDQYGTLTASQLRGLSHSEEPWLKAHGQGMGIIGPEELRTFYATQLDDAVDLHVAEMAEKSAAPLVPIDDLVTELGW